MRETRRDGATGKCRRPARAAAFVLLVALAAASAAPRAQANVGYVPDSVHPFKALPGGPRGLAVDQENGDIYVAIASTNPSTGAPGEIVRYNSDLSTDGTFAAGGGFYTGVALDPVSHGFFAAQMELRTSVGNFGTPRLDRFSSSGTSAGSFALGFTDSLPPIITNSAGHIYFPSVNTHSVQIFDSTGTLLENVTCSGCPGGSFGKPASVALDASGALYVADANPDRVVKLTSSGGAYSFSSTVQSGLGAGAVAVDPATGDILVGDFPDGRDYHIVAYNSSGTQFDDFAAGIFPASTAGYGALSAYQIAVNGSTHKVYVGSTDKFYVFEKATIGPPSATAEAATNIGQLGATLNATVNANGHAVLSCEFEYTDEADFLVNGFSNASGLPCPEDPDGTGSVHVGTKVSGLSPVTAYRYRLTAASNGGSVSSGNQSFETLPELPPVVTTEAAQAVTQSTATIKAKVNPKGGSVTNCHFDFGTSQSYGSNLSCATSPGSVNADVAEARAVSGLTPATIYHYRLVVTSNAGTVEGDDVEFTTASPPLEPQPEQPSAPGGTVPPSAPPAPPVATPPPAPCKKGFRRQRINGHARCVKVCRRGFRRKRSHGRVSCVRVTPAHRRSHHRRAAR